MTKEEIKYIKEQENKLRLSYEEKLKDKDYELRKKDSVIKQLEEEVALCGHQTVLLKDQIKHLETGLSGEELDYLEPKA